MIELLVIFYLTEIFLTRMIFKSTRFFAGDLRNNVHIERPKEEDFWIMNLRFIYKLL